MQYSECRQWDELWCFYAHLQLEGFFVKLDVNARRIQCIDEDLIPGLTLASCGDWPKALVTRNKKSGRW